MSNAKLMLQYGTISISEFQNGLVVIYDEEENPQRNKRGSKMVSTFKCYDVIFYSQFLFNIIKKKIFINNKTIQVPPIKE